MIPSPSCRVPVGSWRQVLVGDTRKIQSGSHRANDFPNSTPIFSFQKAARIPCGQFPKVLQSLAFGGFHEKRPHRLIYLNAGPQLMVLFVGRWSLAGGSRAGHWRWVFRFYSLATLPVSSRAFHTLSHCNPLERTGTPKQPFLPSVRFGRGILLQQQKRKDRRHDITGAHRASYLWSPRAPPQEAPPWGGLVSLTSSAHDLPNHCLAADRMRRYHQEESFCSWDLRHFLGGSCWCLQLF